MGVSKCLKLNYLNETEWDEESQMVGGKPVGFLQVWSRISPWDYHEQIHLEFRTVQTWTQGLWIARKQTSRGKYQTLCLLKGFFINRVSHDCHIDIDRDVLTAYFFIRR